MLRIELVGRLRNISHRLRSDGNTTIHTFVDKLMEEVEADGVLDIQTPNGIAQALSLPRSSEQIDAVMAVHSPDRADIIADQALSTTQGDPSHSDVQASEVEEARRNYPNA